MHCARLAKRCDRDRDDHRGDLGRALQRLAQRDRQHDVHRRPAGPGGLELASHAAGGNFSRVIIDPPRGGMDKKALSGLIGLRAPVFLYVSCNPATLARDLQTICEGGYAIDAIQPVDMFPHTYHVETLVRLKLKDLKGLLVLFITAPSET